jgi:hypothetical protein
MSIHAMRNRTATSVKKLRAEKKCASALACSKLKGAFAGNT